MKREEVESRMRLGEFIRMLEVRSNFHNNLHWPTRAHVFFVGDVWCGMDTVSLCGALRFKGTESVWEAGATLCNRCWKRLEKLLRDTEMAAKLSSASRTLTFLKGS